MSELFAETWQARAREGQARIEALKAERADLVSRLSALVQQLESRIGQIQRWDRKDVPRDWFIAELIAMRKELAALIGEAGSRSDRGVKS